MLSGDGIVSPRGWWWMGSFEGVRAAGREKGDRVLLDLSYEGARADTFLTTRHLSKVNSRQVGFKVTAYDSEDVKETTVPSDDIGGDCPATEKKPKGTHDLQDDLKNAVAEQDPTAELSGHDADGESHVSESSEPTSDAEGTSIKNKDEATSDFLKDGSEDSVCSSDSLEQMKAIYKSFLNNPYWSFLSLNSSQLYSEEQPANSSGSSSNNSSPGRSYDWHQSAVAKTLQQVSQKQPIALEPSLFSTVQLYRQSTKLYGSIFTGASKFHCKSCSAAYDTLLELTVHMNKTDHYRDDNHESASKGSKSWSKPRKRSLLEMEGKEDAQKVLRCMYCGHSFESLQDLSVHMIKTKHYQKVPLREPRTAIAAKAVSSFRKRVPVELDIAQSLHTTEQRSRNGGQAIDVIQMFSEHSFINKDESKDQKSTSHGVQLKSQNIRCMDCGILHDSLEQLSAHMMLTGHFVKATQSSAKANKPLPKQASLPPHPKSKCDKTQLGTQSSSSLSATGIVESSFPSPPNGVSKNKTQEIKSPKDNDRNGSASLNDSEVRQEISSKCDYLTEEDLKGSPKMEFDILKSLENTVASAINKAQRGAPSWGGYQSIHAAYQLQNHLKPATHNLSATCSLQQSAVGQELQSLDKSPVIPAGTPPSALTTPLNFHVLDELETKITENSPEVGLQFKRMKGQGSPRRQLLTAPDSNIKGKIQASSSPSLEKMLARVADYNTDKKGIQEHSQDSRTPSTSVSDQYDESVHSEPRQPSVSPLSALQSVMNLHLGKAAKPVMPVQDPMSMLLRMSNSMAEKAALAGPSGHSKLSQLHSHCHENYRDQPIDLSKGKSEQCLQVASLPGKALSSSLSSTYVSETTDSDIVTPIGPLCENALSDISVMLQNLSDSHVSKPPTLFCRTEQSEIEGSHTSDEAEDMTMMHKRKGRQSHWKPQHLLILQAQFSTCLRQTADGKYVISDLSSRERIVISHLTGLSMTTISHWLANVKYQLRRTGRTKFIKNIDSGHPVFFCSECATQFQARSTYICHLESHLGFKLKDLAKLTSKDLNRKAMKYSKSPPVLSSVSTAKVNQEKPQSV
ncbi:Teashirt -like protein 3 [Triplophysa tibetana]|uniref:Teashirt-like protein 3 n=1 Tax=Triplophysa tibetana TaxID=1572043 RepID=A0A5A9P2V9_9TELE|nr:Teashirt -like protein 3 [Triplophysa tibetana]